MFYRPCRRTEVFSMPTNLRHFYELLRHNRMRRLAIETFSLHSILLAVSSLNSAWTSSWLGVRGCTALRIERSRSIAQDCEEMVFTQVVLRCLACCRPRRMRTVKRMILTFVCDLLIYCRTRREEEMWGELFTSRWPLGRAG